MQTMDILLVDDDKAYLGIVHDLLKTRGYALSLGVTRCGGYSTG